MATRKSHTSRKAATSRSTSQVYPRRAGKTLRAAIDDFLLDRESRNFSSKTLVQHRTSLAHLANFLEKQHNVTHLSMIEAVHLRAWLVFLAKEPGVRGKSRIPRTTRTCRWYGQSMHAFCNWLMAEQYIEENPAERVELPKLEKPLIRIIEFEEFEALLSACAAPQEKGFIADRNAARNRAILWVLWDTGIRVGELCDLRLSNFDRRQGTLIVFGKGKKERRVALGRNALRALLYYLDRWRQDTEELGAIGNPNEEHVFLSEGGEALTIHGIEMLFKRLRARTGIKGKRISAHIFRHTFAVRYLMLGGDIFSLQELLGHEDISTIKNYMHLNDVNVQAQKRKFSPGDNVPFATTPGGRRQRSDFREPVRGRPRAGRGKKPNSSNP
jgi:site-specific recombinase XerD